MKEAKTRQAEIDYLDVLTEQGGIDSIDGLSRAPTGVNDRNGFEFISHIGDVYPSGLLPVKAGNVRTNH